MQLQLQLYFGNEGQHEAEHDPEYIGRPFAIVQYDATPVSVLFALSPQR